MSKSATEVFVDISDFSSPHVAVSGMETWDMPEGPRMRTRIFVISKVRISGRLGSLVLELRKIDGITWQTCGTSESTSCEVKQMQEGLAEKCQEQKDRVGTSSREPPTFDLCDASTCETISCSF